MPENAPSPRVLVRASERGPADAAFPHPYNPRSELHGWMISRAAGLTRVAVNLGWIPPGRESAIYHRHWREEEWVYFLEGRGIVELEDAEHEVGPGDFVAFPPGTAHHVRNAGSDRLLLLVGGEIISDVEVAEFPRLRRRMVRMGTRVEVYPMDAQIEFIPGMKDLPRELLFASAPAAEPPRLLVRAAERGPLRTFHHPQNPRSEVGLLWLSRPALKRISVGVAAVPAGQESFVRHVHRHDEEWMYVLSGTGVATVGAREEPVGPGDFLGFPAGEPAHNLRADAGGELVYLQGGDAWSRSTIEIVDFPGLGLRKTFVGTRDALTFPVAAALEAKEG